MAFLSSTSLVLIIPSTSFLHNHPIPYHPKSHFLDFLRDSLTFVVILIILFLIMSSFVTLHIYRSIRIYSTYSFLSCAFFATSVLVSHNSTALTTLRSRHSSICHTALHAFSPSCRYVDIPCSIRLFVAVTE